MAWTGRDRRRRHDRYRGALTVQLEVDAVRRTTAVFEVSGGGAFIETLRPLTAGTMVKIHVLRDDGSALTLDAEVRYFRRENEDNPTGIGVSWHELDAEARAWLKTVIERAAAGEKWRKGSDPA